MWYGRGQGVVAECGWAHGEAGQVATAFPKCLDARLSMKKVFQETKRSGEWKRVRDLSARRNLEMHTQKS
jgi:hypothetical protein